VGGCGYDIRKPRGFSAKLQGPAGVDQRWARSTPLIVNRAVGVAVDRAVDLVHGSMVDRPKGYALF
jgi:hypothetical protein